MRRATTVALLVFGLALAGCSGAPDNGKPVKPAPAVTSSTPTKSHAEQLAACTDAIAAGKDEGDGAPECAPLSADDYLKALQGANERGRDAFQSAIASASAAAR